MNGRVDVVYVAGGGQTTQCCQDDDRADHFVDFLADQDRRDGLPPRRVVRKPCTGQHPPRSAR